MHPSSQEIHPPALGHLEEHEGNPQGGSSPKLGRRIKAAASSFATKLHIPGSGQPSSSTTGPGHPAVEHHRVTAHHVTPESVQQPQWQVEPQKRLQKQHLEMPPSPATPLRAQETTPHEPPLPSTQIDVSLQPSLQVEEPSVAPISAGLLQQLQLSKNEDVGGETLFHHQQGAGTPTIPTPFSGVESPQRLSSDTDELKPQYIKAVSSLDRSTESQEVYVEDLETLVEEKAGGVGGGGVGGRSAAERLKAARPIMQPPVQEEEGEGEEVEEEEQHTHAGPSPLYSSGGCLKEGEVETPVAAVATAVPVVTPTKEEIKESIEEEEQERIEEEIYAAIEAEEQVEKEEDEEDQAIAAARRKVELEEAEASAAGRQVKVMTPPLEFPSGKIVIPALEVPDTIAVPRRADTGRAFLQAIQTWVFANPILLFLFIAGTASLAYVAFSSSSSTFKDFGPLLLLSGVVALAATGLARYTITGGTSILPLPEREMAEADVPDTTSTVGGGGSGDGGEAFDNLPPGEQPGPSEPVSKESTEDLVHHPESLAGVKEVKQHGEGVLERVEHAVGGAATAAKEGLMSAIDPGQEMVGEVIQETDTGEKVLLPDTESPLYRAEDAVAHAAAKVKNVVAGGGEAEKTTPVGGGGASFSSDPAVQKSGVGGYSSDSDVPGPVIEGVHPMKDGGHVLASYFE